MVAILIFSTNHHNVSPATLSSPTQSSLFWGNWESILLSLKLHRLWMSHHHGHQPIKSTQFSHLFSWLLSRLVFIIQFQDAERISRQISYFWVSLNLGNIISYHVILLAHIEFANQLKFITGLVYMNAIQSGHSQDFSFQLKHRTCMEPCYI